MAAAFATGKAAIQTQRRGRPSAKPLLSQHTTSKGAMCERIFHLEVRVLVLQDLLAEVDCAKSGGLGPDQRSTVCQSAADA